MRRFLAVFLSAFLISGAVPHAQNALPPRNAFPVWITPPTFISGGGVASGSIIPAADNTYDLGSSTFRWRNIYFGTQLLSPDGSSSTPFLSTLSEPTTGFYRRAAGEFTFTGLGTPSSRFDNGGITVVGSFSWASAIGSVSDNSITRTGATALATTSTWSASGYLLSGNTFGSSTVGPSSVSGTTSTAVLQMAGLGGSFTTRTGRFSICMSGNLDNTTVNDGSKVQISFGTTVPTPTLNAPLQGTQVGPIQQLSQAALPAATITPYGACWVVTGQTKNTTFWTDVAYGAITGGTAVLSQASVIAYDIP